MAANRYKTARAVQSNAGIRAAYNHRILALVLELEKEALADILTGLSEGKSRDNIFAEDARPPREQLMFDFMLKELQNRARTPERAEAMKELINAYIAKRLPVYLTRAGTEARKLARRYVLRIAKSTGEAQRQSLVSAGAPVAKVAQELSEFGVRGYYLSKGAVEALPAIIEENTGLIKNLVSSELARIQDAVTGSVLGNGTYGNLIQTLRETRGFTVTRINTVALDQTNKITQAIQRENSKGLGINKGVWIHTPGLYTSRKTHLEFNGKVFDLDKGLFDSEVNKYVVPGECINCRCTFRPVLPDYLIEGTDSKN